MRWRDGDKKTEPRDRDSANNHDPNPDSEEADDLLLAIDAADLTCAAKDRGLVRVVADPLQHWGLPALAHRCAWADAGFRVGCIQEEFTRL